MCSAFLHLGAKQINQKIEHQYKIVQEQCNYLIKQNMQTETINPSLY